MNGAAQVVVAAVLTLTRTIKSVVTGQAPVTLEWRSTLGGENTQISTGIIYRGRAVNSNSRERKKRNASIDGIQKNHLSMLERMRVGYPQEYYRSGTVSSSSAVYFIMCAWLQPVVHPAFCSWAQTLTSCCMQSAYVLLL